ncbi:MAG: NifU family protein [Candidatus Eisenbacteria bacterium]|uniref:NifU family protein n=1 Tax=Eiseniibacteriota bacterium TaxID=2212470 RepID=A0A849SYH5_UNCEI|nr:NifU family protein [Candidatus Eisenbacteria bacterium]
MQEQVKKIIDQLRPVIQADGGDLELMNVSDDGVVTLRVKGSCTGCGSAAATLRSGIERWIRGKVPGVREVVASE